MTFREAYVKTLGKEAPVAPTVVESPTFTQDDMKAYVDAKMDDIRKTIDSRMDQFLKEHNVETVADKITKPVETPEETKEQLKENIKEKEGE